MIEPTAREFAEGIDAVRRAMEEDLGGPGGIDLTAVALGARRTRASMIARQAGTVCGLALAAAAFQHRDIDRIDLRAADGDNVQAGAVLLDVEGAASDVLAVERTALNFVQRLAGTATLTARFVAEATGTGARIYDTRKTTPGMRSLQRWAVRCGGGVNHRFGLFDEAMLKDNHIAAAGGIAHAVDAIRAAHGAGTRIHVEADTLDQVREAVAAGADVVLLDNMTNDQLAEAVDLVGGRCATEASGGVNLDTVASIARTGVDRISVGALTHSAPAFDVALDVLV